MSRRGDGVPDAFTALLNENNISEDIFSEVTGQGTRRMTEDAERERQRRVHDFEQSYNITHLASRYDGGREPHGPFDQPPRQERRETMLFGMTEDEWNKGRDGRRGRDSRGREVDIRISDTGAFDIDIREGMTTTSSITRDGDERGFGSTSSARYAELKKVNAQAIRLSQDILRWQRQPPLTYHERRHAF